MKKYIWLFCLIAVLGFSEFVQAQSLSKPLTYKRSAVFSPALFDSKLWNAQTPAAGGNSAAVQRQRYRRTMTLRYEPGLTELSEEQKNMLLPVVDRVNKRGTKRAHLIAASRDVGDSPKRLQNIINFLNASTEPGYKLNYTYQLIPIDAVMDSNNNTVKIIEFN